MMNTTLQSGNASTHGRRFVLELIGFSDAEKTLLGSTFRLTGRRAFWYAEASASSERADLYLVNADHPDSMKLLQERGPTAHVPAVLIGRNAVASDWPRVDRPI
ncbi:MAG: hypothetical protein ACREX0_14035, partial [Noviherbaspirillum sp.]